MDGPRQLDREGEPYGEHGVYAPYDQGMHAQPTAAGRQAANAYVYHAGMYDPQPGEGSAADTHQP
eukprot:9619058-Lingulodinium_polyedra.AAC.1